MAIDNHHIYYQRDPRVPMTYVSFVYHGAGAQQEPEEKAGLARMTAKMLFRGTQTMTREAIARKFELLGAEASAHVSETDFVVSISAFTSTIKAVLAFVARIIREADFPQGEVELLQQSEMNQMEAALQDAERILSASHNFVLYDGMRFGKIGSKRGVSSISREDLRVFFSNVVSSSTMYITSLSDLPENALAEVVQRFTSSRRSDGFMAKPEVKFKEARGREAVIVESKGATNDRFIWSQRGIEATDERRFDLGLVVDALGSFEGFLFDVLRNKNGWCYGAYAFVTPATTRPGRIGFYADPSHETSSLLIPEFLNLLERFPAEEDFRNRLRQRNETFKNRYSYQLDPRYILSSKVARDRFGIPILSQGEYNGRIDEVTEETARKVIADVFDSRNLVMVFYGDPERIRRILSAADSSISVMMLEKEVLIA